MKHDHCRLTYQGRVPGCCSVTDGDRRSPACQVPLRRDSDGLRRLISAEHLSRPEHYLSIYQSGFNLACCPKFYAQRTALINALNRLWVLNETNGYSLTVDNLARLQDHGADALLIASWEDVDTDQ